MTSKVHSLNRLGAAIEAATLAMPGKPIQLAVDPLESPVGYQDTPDDYLRAWLELDTHVRAHGSAMKATGFSRELFAKEWLHGVAHAEGPCSIYIDASAGCRVFGEIKPEELLERLISDVYDECHGQTDIRVTSQHSHQFGYWKLRQALWHLKHPLL